MKKAIMFVFAFVLLMASVSALGVTPGRTTLDFQPGEQKTVEFTVINTDEKDINLVVLVQGELNRSIAVSDVSFSLAANEKEKKLSYTITMPRGLRPGLRTAEILVIQLPEKSETSEAFVGAAVGVATQVHVRVAFPGKFAEAALNVIGPDSEGIVHFVVPVVSRGELDLVRVRGLIEVYGPLNEKVATLNTNEMGLPSGSRGELASRWDPDVAPGKYRAVATIIYDEDTITLEKEFNVGQQVLEVVSIEVRDFRLGEIAKFEILVENKWGEPIRNAFAEMKVYNERGEVMAEFKSQNYDVPSLEKHMMVAFWDTGGTRRGTYNAELFLKFGQHSQQHDLKLEVSDNNIRVVGVGYVISERRSRGGDNTVVIILSTAIGLLIIINLLWFIFLRKKLMANGKR
jgi:hypothetical protein